MQQLDPDLLLVAYERPLPLAPDRLQLAASPMALMPIHADPDRLQQCLAASVENAIAYAQERFSCLSPRSLSGSCCMCRIRAWNL